METSIVNIGSSQLAQAGEIKWELLGRKKYILHITYALVGLGLLLAGLIQGGTFWNFFTTCGLVALIMLANIIYHSTQSREKYLANLKEKPQNAILTLERHALKYQTVDIESVYQWRFFSGFKVHKGFLFLIADNNILSSFAIPEEGMSREEFTAICKYVAGFLAEVQ